MESDTMGVFATIRRQANRKGVDASVQRFVIHAADASRASILANQPNEVDHVFAWIEYVDSMSEKIYQTFARSIEAGLLMLAASTSYFQADRACQLHWRRFIT